MIHYQLRCIDEHEFEGWFRDSTAFEQQARGGLLSCPHCGSGTVERALMTPSVRSSRKQAPAPAEVAPAPLPAGRGAVLPDMLRSALQRLRVEVEQRCDDVGDRFAEIARTRHRAPPDSDRELRGIYGRTSEAEREALAEEGIEVVRIPWLPRADG